MSPVYQEKTAMKKKFACIKLPMETSELLRRVLFAINPLSPFNWVLYIVCMLVVHFTLGAYTGHSIPIGACIASLVSGSVGYNIFSQTLSTLTGGKGLGGVSGILDRIKKE